MRSGPKGTLINVARGTVVDERALITALAEGRLGHAALDVFEHEPNVAPELLALPNVIVQPHQGSATVETRTAIGQLMIDNISAHFAGKPLLTPVRESRFGRSQLVRAMSSVRSSPSWGRVGRGVVEVARVNVPNNDPHPQLLPTGGRGAH